MERNLLLLAISFCIVSASDTFWFSYRSVTSDKTLIYEEKNISPVMIPFVGKKSSTCRVKIDKKRCNSKLECLNKNFYKILPCFYKSSIKIISQTKTTLRGIKDKVELTIIPVHFIADFKDDFANIAILK